MFERKGRRKFENGRVVEYWEDVPIAPPSQMQDCFASRAHSFCIVEKPKAPMERYKEWKFDEDISLGRIFPSIKGTRFERGIGTLASKM